MKSTLTNMKSSRWILVVFVAAIAVRITVVLLQLRFGLFDISFEATDSTVYRAIAENVLRNYSFAVTPGEPTAYITPGYPLFLASLFVLSGSTMFIAIAQSVIGAGTAVLIAVASERVGGHPAGLLAGLMASVYPHLLFWTGYVTSETLYTFFVVLSVMLLLHIVTTKPATRWPAFLAGGALGAGALTRPVLLGFGLVVIAGAIFRARWRREALWITTGLLLVMAPWVARNAIVFDSVILTSTETGYVLWQGNSPDATGGSRGYVDLADFEPLEMPDDVTELERNRRYTHAATTWMVDHPTKVASLVPTKLWNMFRPTYEGASRVNALVTYASYVPIILVAIVGLVRLLAILPEAALLLVVFLLFHLVFHGLVTGMIRFRLPVEAVLLIPAGVGLASLLPFRANEPGADVDRI